MGELLLRDFAGVAFDFDGTLTKQDLHTQARLIAYERVAEETQDERFITIADAIHAEAHLHTSSPAGINAWILAEAGITDNPDDLDNEHVLRIVEKKLEVYRELIAGGQDQMPGAVDLFKRTSVRKPGKVGIVTTANEWEVNPFLIRYGLGKYVSRDKLVCREDLSDPRNVKPDPEAYKIFLGRLSIGDPGDLLAIEDSPFGIEAAKNAGIMVVAVATSRSIESLELLEGQQKPDAIAKSHEALGAMLGVSV
jgi:phosphoglycolate phosphatase-like HAD superfamily hydrolase